METSNLANTKQWNGPSLGGMGGQAQGLRKEGVIDEAARSIEEASKAVAELAARVGAFANETIGPEPENESAGHGPPIGSDRASQLRHRLASLHGCIALLRREVDRLSSI
jgi:hypothetical protein